MKAKKGLWVLLLVIVLAVFAVSAYKVASHLLDRGASRRFQEELIDQMVTMVSETDVQDAQAAQPAPQQGAAVSSYAHNAAGEGDAVQVSEMPLQQPSEPNFEEQSAPVQNPPETVSGAGNAAADSEPAQRIVQTTADIRMPMDAEDANPTEETVPAATIAAAFLQEMQSTEASSVPVPSATVSGGLNVPEPTMPPADEITPGVTPQITAEPAATPAVQSTVTPAPTPSETAPIAVDFAKLTSKYPDVVCWVYLPGSPVNYAVAQGEDNTQYLRRLLGGGYSYSGSIFMDHLNTPDFSDWNTILYGHNMKNGSMFGYIPYYAVQQYYDQHPYLYILTPDQDYKVELFAGYVTTPDSDAYLIAQTMEERDDIIAEAMKMTTFEADVEIGPEDRIVTLSTCTYAYDNARYVLLGVLRPLAPQAA